MYCMYACMHVHVYEDAIIADMHKHMPTYSTNMPADLYRWPPTYLPTHPPIYLLTYIYNKDRQADVHNR